MKLYTKSTEKPFWSVSFSNIHENRTTDAKIFDTLKAAKECLKFVKGYIIRHEIGGAKVVEFNHFKPSATEQARIRGILINWNDA